MKKYLHTIKIFSCLMALLLLATGFGCTQNNTSLLFNKPQKVTDSVWSAIGAIAPPTYENSGHNNNLSFIITGDGVVVVNAGASYLLAQSLHQEIKKITKEKVKYVILENGQGHAMLGTDYWQQQGAIVIAQQEADHEIAKYGQGELDFMKKFAKEKAEFTKLSKPDETFATNKTIKLGKHTIELINLGPAHSPGDIVVWLPQQQLVISGDMAFYQRMLPVFEHTNTKKWLVTWEKFANLKAKIVIPGHGDPTNMAEVTKATKDYLIYMRTKVSQIVEDGGSLLDAYKIDQSPYSHLATFEELSKQNSGRIYREMEFE